MLIIKIPECDFHFELHCWALLWRWLLTFPVQTVFLLPDTKTQHKCCKYDKSSVSRTLLSLYIHKFIYLYTNIYISYVLFISDVTFTHLSPETFNFKHWKYVYIFCSSVPVNPPPPSIWGCHRGASCDENIIHSYISWAWLGPYCGTSYAELCSFCIITWVTLFVCFFSVCFSSWRPPTTTRLCGKWECGWAAGL